MARGYGTRDQWARAKTLRGLRFRFKRPDPMYIPTKSPRKLDRKRSKLLRSKVKAKNRSRREGLKK